MAAANATPPLTSWTPKATSSSPNLRHRLPSAAGAVAARLAAAAAGLAAAAAVDRPGRGRKSEATKAADQAKLAAFLAAKYPDTSKFAARW